MKKILTMICAAAVLALGVLCLSGCAGQSADSKADSKASSQTSTQTTSKADSQVANVEFTIEDLSSEATPMLVIIATEDGSQEYTITNGEKLTTKTLKPGEYKLEFYKMPVNPDGTSYEIEKATYIEKNEGGVPLYEYPFTIKEGEPTNISLTFTKLYPKDQPDRLVFSSYNAAVEAKMDKAAEALKDFAAMAEKNL